MIKVSDRYITDEERFRSVRIGSVRLWWPFPLAKSLHSSSAVVLGWLVHADAPKAIGWLHRRLRTASDGVYWVRYRVQPSMQFHFVRTGLKPGYADVDERMLHACMTLLGEYIDENDGAEALAAWSQELRGTPDPHAPAGLNDAQADRQDEAVAIYRWWTVTKPADERRRDELTQALFGKRRMTFEPVGGNADFYEMKMDPFTEDEETLHADLRALEKKIEDDEETMLVRLMKIRRSLWT